MVIILSIYGKHLKRSFFSGSGLGDVLKKRGDLREGQRVYSYDLVYMTLKDTFNRFSLPLPLTFQSAIIDRTSMTYFNTSEEVFFRKAYYFLLQFRLKCSFFVGYSKDGSDCPTTSPRDSRK